MHDNDHDLHKLGTVPYLVVSLAEKAHRRNSAITAKRNFLTNTIQSTNHVSELSEHSHGR